MSQVIPPRLILAALLALFAPCAAAQEKTPAVRPSTDPAAFVQQLWPDAQARGVSRTTFDAALSWFAGYADASMVTTWWKPDVAGFNQGFMAPNPEIAAAVQGNTHPPYFHLLVSIASSITIVPGTSLPVTQP